MKSTRKLLSAVALMSASLTAMASTIAGGQGVAASEITTTPTAVLAYYDRVGYASQAPAGMSSTYTGTYSTGVYKDSSNTLCASAGDCLTFAIQVSNDAASADGIETVTAGPFTDDYLYNVGYVSFDGQVVPMTVTDSDYGAIRFSFMNTTNMIYPGQTSAYLIIQTSAMNYKDANISFQDSQTATVAGFAPAAVTPEPSSLVLLGTGMFLTAGLMYKRVA